MKRTRERLGETPHRKSGFFYRARSKKKSRKRERLFVFEPASATFTALMQEIGSKSPSRRHRAARQLAAHCAVVFREP